MMTNRNHVFISYRREGGDMLANLLYTRLKDDGYAPFFDVETLRSGKFNEQLYSKILECEDFICILPPHGLDRCTDEKDWVRLEIAKAIELKKNIIPVLMRGFVFPDNLPNDIAELALYNGISANSEYFDATYMRLKGLLSSKQSHKQSSVGQITNSGSFTDLVEHIYESLVEFREALRAGNQGQVNSATTEMQQYMQKLYVYYERHQFTEKTSSEYAKQIITGFNHFVNDYNMFSSFPLEKRMSPEAQQYAFAAENKFNDLLLFVIKLLPSSN